MYLSLGYSIPIVYPKHFSPSRFGFVFPHVHFSHKFMKKHLILFATLLLLVAPLLADFDPQGPLTVGHVLNLATRQRMLTQRAAKAFVLSSMGIDADLNDEQVLGCVASFDANQTKLADYAPNLEVKTKIARVNNLWADYKQMLLSDRNQAGLLDVIEHNQAIFLACDEVVKSMNEYAAVQPEFDAAYKLGKSRNIVDAAARVRSLSQRMSYYSAVMKSGVKYDQTQEFLEQAHADFRTHLGSILLFSENSPAAKADIDEIVGIWEKYNSLDQMLSGQYELPQMIEDFNKVVSLVDHVVLEYEAALDNGEQVSRN